MDITQSCVLFLWLHTLTSVSSEDCTLQDFVNGELYDRNFNTVGLQSSYPPGEEVRVGCVVGYTGFFKLQCMRGRWQSIGKICQRKSCGHPGDAQFADFILEGEDFVFGSQVVYTCHKGYQMVSRRNTRRCMEKGWDGTIPVCEALQCPAISADNNVQMIGDADEANYGNVLRFTCRSSNEILYGSQQIYCNEHGQWSDEAPKCREVTCPVPVIENGYVLGNIQEYKQHEYLEFECNPTYKRSEARDPTCTRTGPRAEWSPTPVCEPITCRLPQFPTGGASYDPPYRNVFPPGERVKITCGDRYYISRPQDISAVATCKDDGEWSFQLTCREVTCNRPRDPTLYDWRNWEPRLKLLDTVRYSCRGGYKRTDGATEATCTRDGWSPNPLCQEITCNRRDFHNADVEDPKQTYRDGEHASYVCKEGYRGSFYLTCGKNGWSGQQQCKPVTCKVKHFQNADIDGRVQSVYNYNDQVEYDCKDGFKGRFSITCRPNGWVGSPGCTKVTCRRKDIPYADIEGRPRQVYTYGDRVHYNCKDGREGSFSLTCGQNGWGGSEDCREITCYRKYFQNADIEGTAKSVYKYNERVQYVCKNHHDGRFSLTCGQNGWEGSEDCRVHTECQKPDVQHGFIVGPYNETLYYTCEEGYKLVTKPWWGEAKCGSTEALAQCIEKSACGELPVIPHMEVESQRNNYTHGESVTINCKEGYVAQFVRLTCHQGKWNDSETSLEKICQPILSHCVPPPKVTNAVVVTSRQKEYTSGSEATYQCRDQYTIKGVATVTCINGTWEERNFTCTPNGGPCRNPPEVAHAVADTSDQTEYTSGSKVTYQCRDHYTMEGVGRITCINGQWEEEKFTCSPTANGGPCRNPPEVAHAVAETSDQTEYTSGSKVTYQCRDHYIMEGVGRITCINGQWEEEKFTCSPTANGGPCRNPPEVAHAVADISDQTEYTSGSKVTYQCRDHYTMEGVGRITCVNGQWEEKKFICNPTPNGGPCRNPPEVAHAVADISDQTEYTSGSKVTYQCRDHYTMEGVGRITCVNGQWEEKKFICNPTLQQCERPDEIPNGYFQIVGGTRDFLFGTVIKYYCDEGYNMISKVDTRNCLLGSWSHDVPICVPSRCDPPPADEDITMNVLLKYEGSIYPSYILTFSCDRPGKYLNGSPKLTCGIDGQWDNPFPSCEDITCKVGKVLPHVSAADLPETVKHGHTLKFHCDNGYKLEGSEEIVCLQNGEWNAPFPTCVESCEVKDLPPNVRLSMHVVGDQLTKGQKLSFYCPLRGQTLQGETEVECLANGQWSHPFPTCGAHFDCGRPPPLDNGDLKESQRNQYRNNDWVEYTCQNYHIMDGSPYRTCNNGEWTGQMRCLKPCTVDSETMNNRNIRFRYSYDNKKYSIHGDVMEFMCARGRPVRTVAMRQLCRDGVIDLPSCQ
ncbi:complement factor H-like [Seriola aureovittata]|uniref:complement factor H-like n=1 Tax=Seriola aureovittata TaxID=2871759 RepID=UPI0024BECF16|nr:complement factor H-like [Seriola aureovittata]